MALCRGPLGTALRTQILGDLKTIVVMILWGEGVSRASPLHLVMHSLYECMLKAKRSEASSEEDEQTDQK